jgi:dTDP-4-amino-4,6-dideoxygalactose transaminase
MDGLQAAILSVKLPYILLWTKMRQSNAEIYNSKLSSIPQIVIPSIRAETSHSYHLYVVRAERRDELAAFLRSKGVETSIHYPVPLPFLPAYKYLDHQAEDFPVSGSYSRQILSLPMYPELTEEKIDFVCSNIKAFYREVMG